MMWLRRCGAALALLSFAVLGAARAEVGEPLGEALFDEVVAPFTGDLNAMVERRRIRVLTAYSPTHYYLDAGGAPQGLTFEAMRAFEEFVDERFEGVDVVVVTAPREQLLDRLLAGGGDLVAANLTVTPARAARIAFTEPVRDDVTEQVVLAPSAPAVATLDELSEAGITLHVRGDSSYYEHLQALNGSREAPLAVATVAPALSDEDLLGMVASNLLPATVVDSHKLDIWRQIYPELVIPEGLAVNEGGAIAIAVRPDNPDLRAFVDAFVPSIAKGSLLGNILLGEYLGDAERLANVLDDDHRARFEATLDVMKREGAAYGFDPLLLAAQGFQESRLDHSARSAKGAIGIMQMLKSTAREPYVALPDIEVLEVNVEAAAKYKRWLMDTYFDDPAIDEENRMLLALAAYNAGPGNIRKARARAVKRGFDPNRWFDHVEPMTAELVSREPVTYVRNIYRYYAAYRSFFDVVAP